MAGNTYSALVEPIVNTIACVGTYLHPEGMLRRRRTNIWLWDTKKAAQDRSSRACLINIKRRKH